VNVAQFLETRVKANPQQPAIIFKGQNITFEQLRELSLRLVDSLSKLGVSKGDKVAVYLPGCPEYIYSYLAIWCLGAIAVPLDFMLTEEELVSCISHAEAKILITKLKSNLSLEAVKEKCPFLGNLIICGENAPPFLSFDALLDNGRIDFKPQDISDSDYAIIFYTSGTTGKPKGVLVNYRQIEAPAKSMPYFAGLSDKDIALCVLPFSHVGGLVFIQGLLFLGSTVVLMDRFIPAVFLKCIEKYKVTCFWLVPSMYYAILQLKEFEVFNLASLRWVVSFGAPSSAEQLRRFHKYCPKAHLMNGWGMTETQGPSVVLPMGSPKVESVGKPAPWIEVKIFIDQDHEAQQGQIGEIAVRSWVVTDGYYKNPEATAQALRNGWFYTGDLGRFDEEGYLYIVGRKKEMIKVAGEIVFEPEVETILHKHQDVAEVAVVGVEDQLRGEVPKAYVVLKEGSNLSQEELRYFCRQHLAHFKIPHHFEFVLALPKNRAGKVDKVALKATKT